jgi:hypothetical protein
MDAPADVDLALHLEAHWFTLPYQFPDSPDALSGGSAVYCWCVDDRPIYAGQAQSLRKRVQQYVRPGPSQRTNIRLREVLTQRRSAGDRVALKVLSSVRLNGEAVSESALSSKWLLGVLESWLVWWFREQEYDLLNL